MKRESAWDKMIHIRQIVNDSLANAQLQSQLGENGRLAFDDMRESILEEINDYEATRPTYITPQPA